jgi:hypothetical protein
MALSSCGSSPPPATTPVGVSDSASNVAIDFTFDSLDERPVTSAATRGKPTVLVFVQPMDVWSLGQVDYLAAMAKNDGGRVNYDIVVLATRATREVVEAYKAYMHKRGIDFPIALADDATIDGVGPFGALKIPTTVLLDRGGRIAWRADGRLAKSDEIRAQMKGL